MVCLVLGITHGYAHEGVFLNARPDAERSMQVQRVMQFNQCREGCQKTAGISFRVTQVTGYFFTGSNLKPADSTYYTYSGSRGEYDLKRFFDYENPYPAFSYDKATYAGYDNQSNGWVVRSRYTQQFNQLDQTVENIQQDVQGSSWENSFRAQYAYDGQGRLGEYRFQSWDTDSAKWEETIRYTWCYTSSGLIDSLYTYNLNTLSGAWEKSGGLCYQYNSTQDILTKNYFTISGGGPPQTVRTDSFIYANGMLVEKIARKAVPGGWENLARLVIENSNHRVLSETELAWDIINTGWVNNIRNEYSWNGMLIDAVKTSRWDDHIGQWKSSYGLARFAYESFLTALPVVAAQPFHMQVFPNPASQMVTIRGGLPATEPATIALFNITGSCILQKELNATREVDEMINVAAYPRGYYTVRISTASGISTHKLLLQ